MNAGQLLISALQLNQLDGTLLQLILNKKINAMAYEFIKDDSGALPIIRSMSEIAGTASILIAAEYLNNTHIGVVDRHYQILVDNFDDHKNDIKVAKTVINLINGKEEPTFI